MDYVVIPTPQQQPTLSGPTFQPFQTQQTAAGFVIRASQPTDQSVASSPGKAVAVAKAVPASITGTNNLTVAPIYVTPQPSPYYSFQPVPLQQTSYVPSLFNGQRDVAPPMMMGPQQLPMQPWMNMGMSYNMTPNYVAVPIASPPVVKPAGPIKPLGLQATKEAASEGKKSLIPLPVTPPAKPTPAIAESTKQQTRSKKEEPAGTGRKPLSNMERKSKATRQGRYDDDNDDILPSNRDRLKESKTRASDDRIAIWDESQSGAEDEVRQPRNSRGRYSRKLYVEEGVEECDRCGGALGSSDFPEDLCVCRDRDRNRRRNQSRGGGRLRRRVEEIEEEDGGRFYRKELENGDGILRRKYVLEKDGVLFNVNVTEPVERESKRDYYEHSRDDWEIDPQQLRKPIRVTAKEFVVDDHDDLVIVTRGKSRQRVRNKPRNFEGYDYREFRNPQENNYNPRYDNDFDTIYPPLARDDDYRWPYPRPSNDRPYVNNPYEDDRNFPPRHRAQPPHFLSENDLRMGYSYEQLQQGTKVDDGSLFNGVDSDTRYKRQQRQDTYMSQNSQPFHAYDDQPRYYNNPSNGPASRYDIPPREYPAIHQESQQKYANDYYGSNSNISVNQQQPHLRNKNADSPRDLRYEQQHQNHYPQQSAQDQSQSRFQEGTMQSDKSPSVSLPDSLEPMSNASNEMPKAEINKLDKVVQPSQKQNQQKSLTTQTQTSRPATQHARKASTISNQGSKKQAKAKADRATSVTPSPTHHQPIVNAGGSYVQQYKHQLDKSKHGSKPKSKATKAPHKKAANAAKNESESFKAAPAITDTVDVQEASNSLKSMSLNSSKSGPSLSIDKEYSSSLSSSLKPVKKHENEDRQSKSGTDESDEDDDEQRSRYRPESTASRKKKHKYKRQSPTHVKKRNDDDIDEAEIIISDDDDDAEMKYSLPPTLLAKSKSTESMRTTNSKKSTKYRKQTNSKEVVDTETELFKSNRAGTADAGVEGDVETDEESNVKEAKEEFEKQEDNEEDETVVKVKLKFV
ncbi:hypothetical protein HDV05_000740 [Chytridiales sp. JEL 0842]|nr:hypothetical protein HDV05_000740 [Chytridiales sp. JEL 0842]